MVVIHCRGHQKEVNEVSQGNQLLKGAAKELLKGLPVRPLLILERSFDHTQPKDYQLETKWALSSGLQFLLSAWL